VVHQKLSKNTRIEKIMAFKVERVKKSKTQIVTTLVLGSQLKQRLAKVRAKSEA
jgi:hypothetical protein